MGRIWRGMWLLGGPPGLIASDLEGALHAVGARPTEPCARGAWDVSVGALILDPGYCQA